jgi:membrane-associated protease RseP (regulator of RpoE activity)
MRIKYGGWIFLVICFLSIYRIYPLGKSVGLAAFFVLSMVLHELGHAMAARYYGTPVHEVGLCLWGGYIRYERPSSALYHVVILTSGMLTNLMLIVPFWFIPHIGPLVSVWNLFLFVVSVLPFPAFDGGKILRLCARPS